MSEEETTNESNQSPDWFKSLPEGLQTASFFKEDKSVDQIVADLANAATHMGNSIRIPGPDADEAAMADFIAKATQKVPGLMAMPTEEGHDDILKQLGTPDAAENYHVAEDVTIDKDTLGIMKAKALEAGLTQKQFSVLISQVTKDNATTTEAREALSEEAKGILKQEWGHAMEQRMGEVEAFLSEEGAPPEMKAALEAGTLSASSVKWLHGLTQLGAEADVTKQQNDGRSSGEISPPEALHQAQELLARLTKMKPSDPNYAHLVQKRVKLMEKAVA